MPKLYDKHLTTNTFFYHLDNSEEEQNSIVNSLNHQEISQIHQDSIKGNCQKFAF